MKRTSQGKKSGALPQVPVVSIPISSFSEQIVAENVAETSVIEQDALAHIRTAAYLRWESAGCPAGDGSEFWLAAEREYLAAHAMPDPSGMGDAVQEASEESFPASDPPARTISHAPAVKALSTTAT